MSTTIPTRLLLACAMFLMVLAPVGASAQTGSGDDGGVTFDNGLAYEVVHTVNLTGGDNALLPYRAAVTAVDVAGDGTVFFAEHHGAIQTLDPETGETNLLGRVDAATHKCVGCGETNLWEAGLHGFALANDFDETGHFYVSYSVANSSCDLPDNIEGETNAGCWHLSRFTYDPDGTGMLLGEGGVDFTDETVLLTWPFSRFPSDPQAQRDTQARTAAHQGGGITVLPDDSIVISVGDNTSHASHGGYGPRDSRPDRWYLNGERTSMNPADRRGKLLRVNPDGSVPADNPFVGDTGEYRFGGDTPEERAVAYDPYILAMGMRNPYRVASDPVTGAIYSGQVGPDASLDDPARGPAGQEELNVILRTTCDEPTETGACEFPEFNGGYPRCIANGLPYIQYDYEAGQSLGIPEDCSSFDEPVLWYAKNPNDDPAPWDELEFGSGSTIAPLAVYRSDAETAIDSLQDSLLLFDWSRGWVATIPVTESGALDVTPERVDRIGTGMTGPISAAVAPDGSVYVVEFGGYFSVNSRIGRIYDPAAGQSPVAATASDAPLLGAVHPAALVALAMLGAGAMLRRRREIL